MPADMELLTPTDEQINAWLLAHGHNMGGACEKCWGKANRREFVHGGDHYEHYLSAMREAKAEAVAALAAIPTPREEEKP
jgi:hypothetical protein